MLFTILMGVGGLLTTVGGTGFIYESRKEKKEKLAEEMFIAELEKAQANEREAIAKTEAKAKAETEAFVNDMKKVVNDTIAEVDAVFDKAKAEAEKAKAEEERIYKEKMKIVEDIKKELLERAKGDEHFEEIKAFVEESSEEIRNSIVDMTEEEIEIIKVFVQETIDRVFNKNAETAKPKKEDTKRYLDKDERDEIIEKAEDYIESQNNNSSSSEKEDGGEDYDEAIKSKEFAKLIAEAEEEAIAEERARASKNKKNKK